MLSALLMVCGATFIARADDAVDRALSLIWATLGLEANALLIEAQGCSARLCAPYIDLMQVRGWDMIEAEAKGAATGVDQKTYQIRGASAKIQEVVATGQIGVFPATFMDSLGRVDVGRVADAFSMTKGQLAETTGLGAAALAKSARALAPRTQGRVTEMLEIINMVRDWAGGTRQAMAWYRAQPIPALDGRTAEALVKNGRAAAVRSYLDHLALGGYA